MYKQFEKALRLVKKTGDRLILYNTQNDEDAHVVMSLDEYERMSIEEKREVKGLTEEQLIDKINRDIAVWKSEQESAAEEGVSGSAEEAGTPEKRGESIAAKDEKNQEKGRGRESTGVPDSDPRRNHWGIPQDRKKGAAEVVGEKEDKSGQGDDDEDRQYLEEITF